MRRRLVLTERLFVGGVVGAVGFVLTFIFSSGAMPEMAHGSAAGLVTLVFAFLLTTIGLGLLLDWLWPKTKKRWHGMMVGILVSQIAGAVMYLTIVPWQMGVKGLTVAFALIALLLGAPFGAMHWSPPENREEDDS